MCESHSNKSHEMIFLARNHRKITLLDFAHYWVLNFAWISSFHECLMSMRTKCFISRNIFSLLTRITSASYEISLKTGKLLRRLAEFCPKRRKSCFSLEYSWKHFLLFCSWFSILSTFFHISMARKRLCLLKKLFW